MKHFFYISAIFLSFLACDDGDIIVTNFDFADIPLEHCEGVGEYVFFKRNSETLETLSLQLRTQDTLLGTTDTTTYTYDLDGTNNVVHYRTYASEVGSDYFCSSVPPTSPTVNQNYIGNQGTVTVYRALAQTEQEIGGPSPIVLDTTVLVTVEVTDLVLDNGEETLIRETLELGEFEDLVN